MPGILDDTYIAAIQHDIADIPAGATKIGVVRRPTSWFHAVVDENQPVLGPPPELLEEFKTRYECLQEQGMDDVTAHNTAFDEIDYEDQYLKYLDRSEDAQNAIMDLIDRLDRGKDLVLVCYENTDKKRCHRTLLRKRIITR